MDDQLRKVLDHFLITEVLFYPSPVSESDVPVSNDGRVVLIPAGDFRLGGYWHRPHPGAPTVLFFHGNGEVMTDYLFGFHLRVAELGLNFMVVDYQGYGLSTGRPTLSRLVDDARAAWNYVCVELGLSPGEVIIMGRSLGSLAALEIAAGPGRGARALIIESGIASFDQWIMRMADYLYSLKVDVPALMAALKSVFDHEAKIRSVKFPVLVMHAENDEIVPVEHGRALAQWANGSTLHVFQRGGHNDIHYLNQDEYFEVMRDFVSRLG